MMTTTLESPSRVITSRIPIVYTFGMARGALYVRALESLHEASVSTKPRFRVNRLFFSFPGTVRLKVARDRVA